MDRHWEMGRRTFRQQRLPTAFELELAVGVGRTKRCRRHIECGRTEERLTRILALEMNERNQDPMSMPV